MSDEELEHMARSAGLLEVIDDAYLARGDWLPEAREFASLLQSAERDRCAEETKFLHQDRDIAKAKLDRAANLISGIYSLLYPLPITTADGHVHFFRPKDLDPHEALQELSDRIRSLPEALATIQQTGDEKK